MPAYAGCLDMPGAGTSARDADRILPVQAYARLELESDVTLLSGFDQVVARDLHRRTDALFVAAQNNTDFTVFEHAGFLHSSQCGQHHDQSTLHVSDARTSGDLAVCIGDKRVLLKRAGWFEDRIHMADEQQLLSALPFSGGARMLGDEVSRAASLGLHGHPPHFETERFELRRKAIFHRLDAGQVHGSAVEVDKFLKQR